MNKKIIIFLVMVLLVSYISYSKEIGGAVEPIKPVQPLPKPVVQPPQEPVGDNDGMDDDWEIAHELNPEVNDANEDYDYDGLTNLREYQLGTNPRDPDSDDDGVSDGDEVIDGTDPLKAGSEEKPIDTGREETTGVVSELKYVPGELIVKLKSEISNNEGAAKVAISSFDELNAEHGMREIKNVYKLEPENIVLAKAAVDETHDALRRTYKLEFSEDVDVEELVEEYSQLDEVEYAEPNYIYEIHEIPNDPRYGEQYSHKNTQTEDAWDITTGSEDIIVAVIDTGLDYNHEDLRDNIWINSDEIPDNGIDDDENGYIDDFRGWDFVDTFISDRDPYEQVVGEDYSIEENDIMDFFGHGTHVAGIVAAVGNNNKGITGVCWNCKIMPLRIGYAVKRGEETTAILDLSELINSIKYATDNGADIISMSLGKYKSRALKEVIQYSHKLGVVLVASAGNTWSDNIQYPAGYDEVISVTSVGSNDASVFTSSYGYWTDIAAPGERILSTLPSNRYGFLSGTSMAAPYVSGVVGLMLSENPALLPSRIKQILKMTGDNFVSPIYRGEGRVNTLKALSFINNPSVEAEIINPKNGEFIINSNLQIIGKAVGEEYIVELGEGFFPEEWVEIGSGGNIEEGLLASYDITGLSGETYAVKLTVKKGDFTLENKIFLNLLINSVKVYDISFSNSIPLISDLNNDNKKELLVSGYFDFNPDQVFAFYLFDEGANLLPGWPKIYPFGQYLDYEFLSAIGDVDNDEDLEIIEVHKFFGESHNLFFEINAWNYDGTSINEDNSEFSWPIVIPVEYRFSSPSILLGNMDEDSELEIIFLTISRDHAIVKVYDGDGSIIRRFSREFEIERYADMLRGVALGDLDSDGISDMVFCFNDFVVGRGTASNLIISYGNGNEKTIPVERFCGDVKLGDIENDGNLDILLITSKKVLIFDSQGNVKYDNSDTLRQSETFFLVRRSSLADIDNDGDLEILIHSSERRFISDEGKKSSHYIDIYHHDGSVFTLNDGRAWSQEAQLDRQAQYDPLVLDVDRDGELEILLDQAWNGYTLAYNLDGTLVEGFPYSVDYIFKVNKKGNYVTSLKDGFDESSIEWGMQSHDIQHTNNYHTTTPKKGVIEHNVDFDNDGKVDFSDFLLFIGAFGKQQGEKGYDAKFDLDGDGKVGFSDFPIFVKECGKSIGKSLFRRAAKPALISPDFNKDGCVDDNDAAFVETELRKAADSSKVTGGTLTAWIDSDFMVIPASTADSSYMEFVLGLANSYDLNNDGAIFSGDFNLGIPEILKWGAKDLAVFNSHRGEGCDGGTIAQIIKLSGDFNNDGCVDDADQTLLTGALGTGKEGEWDEEYYKTTILYKTPLSKPLKDNLNSNQMMFYSQYIFSEYDMNKDRIIDETDTGLFEQQIGHGCAEETGAAKPIDPNLAIIEQAILEDNPELCKTITDEGLVIECIIECAVHNNKPEYCLLIEHEDDETKEQYQVNCLTKIAVVQSIEEGRVCGNSIVDEGEDCDGNVEGDITYCHNCVLRQDNVVKRFEIDRAIYLNKIVLPSAIKPEEPYIYGQLSEHNELMQTNEEGEGHGSQDDLVSDLTKATVFKFKVTDPFVTSVDIVYIGNIAPIKDTQDGMWEWTNDYEKYFSTMPKVIPISGSFVVNKDFQKDKIAYEYRHYPKAANTKVVIRDVPVIDGYAYILVAARKWDRYDGKEVKIKDKNELERRLRLGKLVTDFAKIVNYNLGIPESVKPAVVSTPTPAESDDVTDEEDFDDEE